MSKSLSLLFIASLLAFGCEQDGSIGTDGVVAAVTRSDTGTPPTTGSTAIVWDVTSGSPDYSVIAGTGSITSTGFEVSLPDPMPADAINSYGVGVGLILAFDGAAPPEGRGSAAQDAAFERLIGASPRHSIIYVAPDAQGLEGWMLDFPVGFSCGVGVEASEGSFDDFAPISCDLVELRIGNLDDFDFVNWT